MWRKMRMIFPADASPSCGLFLGKGILRMAMPSRESFVVSSGIPTMIRSAAKHPQDHLHFHFFISHFTALSPSAGPRMDRRDFMAVFTEDLAPFFFQISKNQPYEIDGLGLPHAHRNVSDPDFGSKQGEPPVLVTGVKGLEGPREDPSPHSKLWGLIVIKGT